jgi:hypothetical protein
MDAAYLGEGWDGDPRGILWTYEEPKPNETYVLGVDPTIGLSGWNRYARSRDDVDTDNGTIEVIKVGRPPKPDLQVAEYAAPIDAIDIAEVINAVGKIYKGKSEEEAALAIIETTGPGVTTVRELLSRYNYPNLWRWMQLDQMKVKRTNTFGWGATRENNKVLFMKSLRHIDRGGIIFRSPWLVEECADCTADWMESTLRAKWGRHDDRVRAFFLAIWAAHDWTNEIDYEGPSKVETGKTVDWQAKDVSYDRMMEEAEDQVGEILDGASF